MEASAIVLAAVIVIAFLAIAGALWKGNVGIISGFPEEPGALREADRRSMGRGLAVLVLFLMLVALLMVFAFSQVDS